MEGTVYRCSNGRLYGDGDLWERFERGTWAPCCWDVDSGTEWVYTTDDELLTLSPIPDVELPPELTLVASNGGVHVESPQSNARRPRRPR